MMEGCGKKSSHLNEDDEDMSRESFISAVISHLEVRGNNSNKMFRQPVHRPILLKAFEEDDGSSGKIRGKRVYRALCFDFPNVSSQKLRGLSNIILQCTKGSEQFPSWFVITSKFLDGILYMGSSSRSCSQDQEAAARELAAMVLIRTFEKVLDMSESCARKLFPSCGSLGAGLENVASHLSNCALVQMESKTWSSMHLTASIFRIVRQLLDADTCKGTWKDEDESGGVRGCWTSYWYLLRDRATHNPNDNMSDLLRAADDIQGIACWGDDDHQRVFWSTLGSLSLSPAVASAGATAKQAFASFLERHLKNALCEIVRIEKRAHAAAANGANAGKRQWCMLSDHVNDLISTFHFLALQGGVNGKRHIQVLSKAGIFRHMLQMWLQAQTDSSSIVARLVGKDAILDAFLLDCCCRAPRTAAVYAVRVPGVLNAVDELSSDAAYAALWPLVLGVAEDGSLLATASSKWLSLAAKGKDGEYSYYDLDVALSKLVEEPVCSFVATSAAARDALAQPLFTLLSSLKSDLGTMAKCKENAGEKADRAGKARRMRLLGRVKRAREILAGGSAKGA